MEHETQVTPTSTTMLPFGVILHVSVCQQELRHVLELPGFGDSESIRKALSHLDLFSQRLQTDDQLPLDEQTVTALQRFLDDLWTGIAQLTTAQLLLLLCETGAKRVENAANAFVALSNDVEQWNGAQICALAEDLGRTARRAAIGANVRPQNLRQHFDNLVGGLRKMVEMMVAAGKIR